MYRGINVNIQIISQKGGKNGEKGEYVKRRGEKNAKYCVRGYISMKMYVFTLNNVVWVTL